MKTPQAKGSNVELGIGFQASFGDAATVGKKLKFNSTSIAANRDLNQSGTIQPGRSPSEPFQGNGEVGGDVVFPNDFNQMYLLYKAAFGAPASTAPADKKAVSAVADNGGTIAGTVKFTVATGHGVVAGNSFAVYGTTNYNGEYVAITADATSITVMADYVGEAMSTAFVTKTGWSHVFKIKDTMPAFTIEQAHLDIAEKFVYKGCKMATLTVGAASDGQENTVTCSVMGSQPNDSEPPAAIASFADATGGAVTVTTVAAHGLTTGNDVMIAGSINYGGRHTVTVTTTTAFSIIASYVAEAVGANPPVFAACQFASPGSVPIKRINTFAAKIFKDGAEYDCAKDFTIAFDFGLDGDQRCIGDNGFRTEIPEGVAAITTTLTALFKDGSLFRAGQDNTTAALKLVYTATDGFGSVTIDLPENKIQQSAPAVDSPMGISQSVTAMAFCNAADSDDSASTITVVNAYASL